MAKTKGTILDNIRGTIGALTFSKNKGGNYVKFYKKSTNPKTPAQLAQQNRFRSLSGGYNALTQTIRQAWADFANTNFNPLRSTNTGQYSAIQAFKAIKNVVQNHNDKGLAYSATYDSGTPSCTLTTLNCAFPSTAPINSVRPDFYDSATLSYPYSFIAAHLSSAGLVDATISFSGAPSAGVTGTLFKDENGFKQGFQFYISEPLRGIGYKAQNPFQQCIGSSGIIQTATPTPATHKGINFGWNMASFIPKFKQFPITGQYVLMTCCVVGENGTISQVGSVYVQVT